MIDKHGILENTWAQESGSGERSILYNEGNS
jgi:hypothetical protein